jgi:hypothetical protein
VKIRLGSSPKTKQLRLKLDSIGVQNET